MQISVLVFIAFVFIEGATAATMVLLCQKWNVLTWYDIHRRSWMPEACKFCLGFWFSVLVFIAGIFILEPMQLHWWYCFTPFTAAAVTHSIVK